jgi:hypothetical protein
MPDFKLIKPRGLKGYTNAAAYSLAKEERVNEVKTQVQPSTNRRDTGKSNSSSLTT